MGVAFLDQQRRLYLQWPHCGLLPPSARRAFGSGENPVPGTVIQVGEDVFAMTYDLITLKGYSIKVVNVPEIKDTARFLTQISRVLAATLVCRCVESVAQTKQ
jgi:hypothetical protein